VSYNRTIHFADTDAAGVVYFATLLSICHEAYEDALMKSGMDLARFFSGKILSGQVTNPTSVIIPITHAEIDFRRPLYCGEDIMIELFWQAEAQDETTQDISEFVIVYTIIHNRSAKVAARAMTRHVCVDRLTHKRVAIPLELERCMCQA
jgi:1,4-dihydroxy-2-naphthoyl-CoA hydrolase